MVNIWQGKLVRLRAVEPDDWATHVAWNLDSDMSRSLDYVWPPASAARVRRWAEEASSRAGDDDAFDFEIEALSDGALVGSLGVHHCDRRVGSFFYGVATLPEWQRRGYASEAILLVARYYFQELRYQKMNADFLLFGILPTALRAALRCATDAP